MRLVPIIFNMTILALYDDPLAHAHVRHCVPSFKTFSAVIGTVDICLAAVLVKMLSHLFDAIILLEGLLAFKRASFHRKSE